MNYLILQYKIKNEIPFFANKVNYILFISFI